MIPLANLQEWQAKVGWPDLSDVEQDLLISRVIVELFSDEDVASKIMFRGGTALNKLFMDNPSRYSEDIDLVHIANEPIGDLIDKIKKIVDPILGKPTRDFKQQLVTLNYKFLDEVNGIRRKVKIEINNQEQVPFMPAAKKKISVESEWFSGSAAVCTYELEELLATKFRALYQRKKGRDLFDLWVINNVRQVRWDDVFAGLKHYLAIHGLKISKNEFKSNLLQKSRDEAFCSDIWKIISPDVEYDQDKAFEFVDSIVSAYMK
jgi:predicted nucleotidyltransferase component of viral defense system